MNTAPVLRTATTADLPTLLQLVQAFYTHFEYPYSAEEKQHLLATVLDTPTLGRLLLVQLPDGTPAGYVFLSYYFSLEYGGLTAFVDELFIDPTHRGGGLGSKALQGVLAQAPALGVHTVRLEIERYNTRAAELYARLGFVDGDRRLMVYHLTPSGAAADTDRNIHPPSA
jgi:GNAT superfamily N-acetyltransferase